MTSLLTILFLIGGGCLAGAKRALTQLGSSRGKELAYNSPYLFFGGRIIQSISHTQKWEALILSISQAKTLLQLLYASVATFYCFEILEKAAHTPHYAILYIILIISISFLFDFFMRVVASFSPKKYFLTTALINSFFLSLLSPITLLTTRLHSRFFRRFRREPSSDLLKEKLLDIFDELGEPLDAEQKKLILSVASFKEKIVRGIMIPRTKLYKLPHDMTIEEAASQLSTEGYSRVPVYRDSVDQIIGILFLKDLFKMMGGDMKDHKGQKRELSDSIETVVRPITYTPETKKISRLLQECRLSHQHLALVVNEYGGTEGIVTIEDIIEELLGEIADEFDEPEERLYTPLPHNTFEIDARMTIEQINVELPYTIPEDQGYDTLGGYVFKLAETIPRPGFTLLDENFTLKVIKADERSIKKILLSPPKKHA